MSEQRELFDAARTIETPCPVAGCGSIRLPGQRAVITCAHDLDPDMDRGRRPGGCLNAYDPGRPDPYQDDIPY